MYAYLNDKRQALLNLGDISVQNEFTAKQKSDILSKLSEKKSSGEISIQSDLAAFAPKPKKSAAPKTTQSSADGKYLMKMNLLVNKNKVKPESVNKFFSSLSKTVNESKLAEKIL